MGKANSLYVKKNQQMKNDFALKLSLLIKMDRHIGYIGSV